MAVIEIPITADGSAFEFSAALNNQLFWFKFNFNARLKRWIFSLLDADKEPIRQGIAVVTGYPVLNRVQNVRKPLGQIVFVDTANTSLPPDFNELGTRVKMVYNEV
jgi:hypothetical protein